MSDDVLPAGDLSAVPTQPWVGERAPVGPPVTLRCSGPVDVADMRAAVLAVRQAISRSESLQDHIEVGIARATNPEHPMPYTLMVAIFGPQHDIRAGAEGRTIDDAASSIHERLCTLLRSD